MDFVDLHFHLLRGVDDGPADLSASLELTRARC
jgi:tyrosine-protein phosphatase YwqE